MTSVLLATSSNWPEGEPGAPALVAAITRRGIEARWACWDDPAVDWAAADLVAVRSTWDYTDRVQEFLAWARDVDGRTLLLNGADVFAWNHDKAYLAGLTVPVVPTRTADSVEELSAAVAAFGTSVVKPRVGAAGGGVIVVDDPADPRLGTVIRSHPELPPAAGPWVVQPLVGSVRTEGETSVFVLEGDPRLPGGQAARRRGGPGARALRGSLPSGPVP